MRAPFDCDVASGLDHQLPMRLLNGKKAEQVSKKIYPLGACRRARLNMQSAPCRLMARPDARFQTRHMTSGRDGIFVSVGRPVNDFIVHVCGAFSQFTVASLYSMIISHDHWPMVIGKVRAWLKYRLDKLFDQDGSNRSKS